MDFCIVIAVVNQLDYTRQCLQSLGRAGVPTASVVIIDNASTDGTREFLAAEPGLRVISNQINRGCAPAWNQGVEAAQSARSEWVVILNNDVVVAPGFREGLLGFAAQSHCDIISPAMVEGDLDYNFDDFAAEYLRKMSRAVRRGVASGVCFMVHRKVFETIGAFDERLGQAGYEDEDFFRRAHKAGFRLAITGRAFLHHFGSVTQKSIKSALGVSESGRLGNRDYFRQKHRLNWVHRCFDHLREQTRAALWRRRERHRFGVTLRLRRVERRWHYG
jgi:N-acetylglucosaminyl-diphospho-decaprenol L-rhamnosyltransferase